MGLEEIIQLGEALDSDYWTQLTPASPQDLEQIESCLEIELPEDFKEFYTEIGWGLFPEPYGGGIDSPDEIISDVSVPIYFVSGSRTPGEEWASVEAHERLWISKGRLNPDPKRFTREAMDLEGVMLWDLLSVGWDGTGGHHNICVGEEAGSYEYCMIHQSILEFSEKSFYAGFLRHLKSLAED